LSCKPSTAMTSPPLLNLPVAALTAPSRIVTPPPSCECPRALPSSNATFPLSTRRLYPFHFDHIHLPNLVPFLRI
jgi:hypothetical protein